MRPVKIFSSYFPSNTPRANRTYGLFTASLYLSICQCSLCQIWCQLTAFSTIPCSPRHLCIDLSNLSVSKLVWYIDCIFLNGHISLQGVLEFLGPKYSSTFGAQKHSLVFMGLGNNLLTIDSIHLPLLMYVSPCLMMLMLIFHPFPLSFIQINISHISAMYFLNNLL